MGVNNLTVGHATPIRNNPFGNTINEIVKNQTCSECEPFEINKISKCGETNCLYKSGKKYDDNKPMLAQFYKHFPNAYGALVDVATYGFNKYNEDLKDPNWKKIEIERYEDALFRHFSAYLTGEKFDPESGKEHLAHIIWNACVLYELNLTNRK